MIAHPGASPHEISVSFPPCQRLFFARASPLLPHAHSFQSPFRDALVCFCGLICRTLQAVWPAGAITRPAYPSWKATCAAHLCIATLPTRHCFTPTSMWG